MNYFYIERKTAGSESGGKVLRRLGLVTVACAALSLSSTAGALECPPNTRFVDEKFVNTSQWGREAKLNTSLMHFATPPDGSVNTAHRQSYGKFAGGSAGAVMTPDQIPPGYFIVAEGSEKGCQGWSVHTPVLKPGVFELRAYCHSGSAFTCIPLNAQVSCYAKVRLCAFQ